MLYVTPHLLVDDFDRESVELLADVPEPGPGVPRSAWVRLVVIACRQRLAAEGRRRLTGRPGAIDGPPVGSCYAQTGDYGRDRGLEACGLPRGHKSPHSWEQGA